MKNFDNVIDIDEAKVKSLIELGDGDPSFLKDLTEIFKERVPELKDDLEKALAASDAERVEKLAHALKGTCGNLGAERMMKICEHLEICGRSGDIANLQDYLVQIEQSFSKVTVALDRVS